MFNWLKQRVRDMRTISFLCQEAEKHALAEGHQQPGAEHFLLAAFDLPDGTARKVFERVRANPDEFRNAIAQQYTDALRNVGINITNVESADLSAKSPNLNTKLYKAKPSGAAVLQGLTALRKIDKRPLRGVHVVLVVSSMKQGVTARALHVMGIKLDELNETAKAEI